ncbi:hypothetical protein CC1G_05062 [Coprinopsis cinerea okayama7|uniref:F-box domain-containing protein n=1 Tax=Coprinopsis cinerea (strain Okayama-7 / 130 / ATCC MYA-4618 / FGSC 9003) TaxID=240176 RepID=A8NSQ6_COPC7|nr:hypothetical protein CC1G_05062 [Coprinopsis cinerea okayama7\|eukprot:XP_001836069.1 hypothetical protein CC1G_05062 [Coprinopsis cinerea okayama7\
MSLWSTAQPTSYSYASPGCTSPFSRLPPEIISLIAEQVKEVTIHWGYEHPPFNFRWPGASSRSLYHENSTLVNCCFVSKQFYAHFRPHIYTAICDETPMGGEEGDRSLTGTKFLKKVYRLLEREPKVGEWVHDFKLCLREPRAEGLDLDNARRVFSWAEWVAEDRMLAYVLNRLTKLREFHLFVAPMPPISFCDFSEPLKEAFGRVFRLKTLRHVDIRCVTLPPALVFSAPGLVQANLWFDVDSSGRRWRSLLESEKEFLGGDEEEVQVARPNLTGFGSDDHLTLVPDHCMNKFPASFGRLRQLDIRGVFPELGRIQKFLDKSAKTLEDVEVIVSGSLRRVQDVQSMTTTLDFGKLERLKKLSLSFHSVPVRLMPAVSSMLATLQDITTVDNFRLAITWSCSSLNAQAFDITPLLRVIDDGLAALAEKARARCRTPVRVAMDCGDFCDRDACMLHLALLRVYDEVDKWFPKLGETGKFEFDVIWRN